MIELQLINVRECFVIASPKQQSMGYFTAERLLGDLQTPESCLAPMVVKCIVVTRGI